MNKIIEHLKNNKNEITNKTTFLKACTAKGVKLCLGILLSIIDSVMVRNVYINDAQQMIERKVKLILSNMYNVHFSFRTVIKHNNNNGKTNSNFN